MYRLKRPNAFLEESMNLRICESLDGGSTLSGSGISRGISSSGVATKSRNRVLGLGLRRDFLDERVSESSSPFTGGSKGGEACCRYSG